MNFELAYRLSGKHIAVQPADLLLSPPESYFYIQDVLILFCGATYATCYVFGIWQVYTYGNVDGPVEYLYVFS
jgi:hypothetical protein